MCSLDETNRLLPAKVKAKAAPRARHAGSKRPHADAMVVYDPADAALRAGSKRQRADMMVVYDPAAAAQRAGALVPCSAPGVDGEPINAVPLAAAAPVRVRTEPWWIRKHLFPHLRLRFDLPVYFIDEKAVTMTDLEPHQNRFRLPTDGVVDNLRPLLTREELEAANLHEEAMGPKHKTTEEELHGRKKRKGKKHGGLPVLVINTYGGIRELQLSQWESSKGTILKGDGYMKFITQCGFKEGDVVEIWAFKQRDFHCFGVTMCNASPLCIVITNKE